MPVHSPRSREQIQAEVDAQILDGIAGDFSPAMIAAGQRYLAKVMYSLKGVDRCARCAGRHAQLTWRALTRPTGFDSWLVIGFVSCPVTIEPIFLTIRADTHVSFREGEYEPIPPAEGTYVEIHHEADSESDRQAGATPSHD